MTDLNQKLNETNESGNHPIIQQLAPRPIQPETLQEFCDRWKMKLSWGYRHTRMKGSDRLPHSKRGRGIRIDPIEGDAWMMGRNAD